MKKLKYFLIITCSSIILLLIVDIFLFRFYFSNIVITSFYQNDIINTAYEKYKYEIDNNSFDLKIKSEKDFYTITLKNKTIKPFLTMSPWRGD